MINNKPISLRVEIITKSNKIQNTLFYIASEKIMIEKELNYVLNEKRYIFSEDIMMLKDKSKNHIICGKMQYFKRCR